MQLLLCILLFVFLTIQSFCQSISGYIFNEHKEPVPYVHIFIRETQAGTATNTGGYYFLKLDPGTYNLVVSSVGYKTRTFQIIVGDTPVEKNFDLESSSVELEEIVVRVNKRDPAYEIIQYVIESKDKFLSQVKSSKTNVYVRASEIMEVREKESEEDSDLPEDDIPVISHKEKKTESQLAKINMTEMQLTLNYASPDRYKEERTAYKSYGNKDGLFIPIFGETDFNFYHNLVNLRSIAEVPVISPVSRLAVLSYKYKLEETLKEGPLVVYKIKVTPRKIGDATCRGYVYINDSTWNINRLELSFYKGSLKFYDAFTVKQIYKEVDEGLWIPYRQEFIYETRSGKKTFKGNTVLVYSEYQKDYLFSDKFFRNEVAVTTKEAYKKDSSYWNNTRPEPLTTEQQKMVIYRDSVQAAHTTKRYLDSIETKYNKITVGEVLYHGIGFRNSSKKSYINLPSLASFINFEVIGGFRLGPFVSYFRRFENGRIISTFSRGSLGLKNLDLIGATGVWMRYNPYRLADVSIRGGRGFYSVNSNDAYLNQLRISNYILHDYVSLYHRIELLNGLYINAEVAYHKRRSVADYDRTSILNRVIDEDDPLTFENYNAFISDFKLSYTPKQRFMTEPNQKVVLGSKFPTFSIVHRKGWNNSISDIDFDYVGFEVDQTLIVGTLGTSKYSLMSGKFVNTRDLRYVDVKRFRQSDPYLYSDPTHSFQLLDTSLVATDLFLEAHYIHHFNGAIINNIPLIKKLRIGTVAGAGAMWIKESNYRHEEIFGGLERVFKLGARRRLRIGVYGVLAQSNYSPPKTDFKISFDLIDTWKNEWSY